MGTHDAQRSRRARDIDVRDDGSSARVVGRELARSMVYEACTGNFDSTAISHEPRSNLGGREPDRARSAIRRRRSMTEAVHAPGEEAGAHRL